MNRSLFVRRFCLTVIAMGLLAPGVFLGAMRCFESMFNYPPAWIPAANPARQTYEWFNDHFEAHTVVVVSWPGCTVDDERLPAFGRVLTSPSLAGQRPRDVQLFARVLSGYEVVRDLMGDPLNLSRSAAVTRVQGTLVGPDGFTSCAIVMLTELGGFERERAVDDIIQTASAVSNVPAEQIRVAGPPVDGAAIDLAASRTMQYFTIPSALLSLVCCWLCLRSIRYAIVVLAAAAFGQGLTLALVWLLGGQMNALLVLMPSLIFVVTIAGGVHLVHYYYDEVRLRGASGAPARAMDVGWLPCALAVTTTAIGMSSLVVSEVLPVRMFGGFSAAGVIAALVLLFLLIPGAMDLWPSTARARETSTRSRFWRSWAGFTVRYSTAIVVLGVLSMFVAAIGLRNIDTSVQLRDLFPERSRVLRDYAWLESNIGPMVPVEVVLRFPGEHPGGLLARLELTRKVAAELRRIPGVAGVVSAATFAPEPPRGGGLRQAIRRGLYASKVERQRDRFIKGKYLHAEEREQAWRISARVPAMSQIDSSALLERVRRRVEPMLLEINRARQFKTHASYTGAIPLVQQTERILLRDLFVSFFTAFVVVAMIMMVVLRSVRAGLCAMLPNLFPAVMVYGLMGWLRTPIDIGTMMTASIALGVAVVDTLHFLTWFRREIDEGNSPSKAVYLAFRHCATAMTQTSLICGLGMLIFFFSTFAPASRFALLVSVLFGAALVGDLILLPAILVSPLGRTFLGRATVVKNEKRQSVSGRRSTPLIQPRRVREPDVSRKS